MISRIVDNPDTDTVPATTKPDWCVLQGDAIQILPGLPDNSINCCVTSPPYWGLRDYGVDGQIGLEETMAEYIGKLVDVFREVRRVLRPDGVLWLNLGDSYNAAGREGHGTRQGYKQGTNRASANGTDRNRPTAQFLKPKDLCGIPWRVALALQDDGWWLRQDIIWHKPNPFPESVKDRCTKSHEYVFLLSKSDKYYWDADSMQEPVDNPKASRNQRHKYTEEYNQSDSELHRTKAGLLSISDTAYETRNKRSVWTITTKGYRGAHFAIFPPELPGTCIKSTCPIGGTVLDPFAGSGTTGMVAVSLNRSFIGIELNSDYIAMAESRILEGK